MSFDLRPVAWRCQDSWETVRYLQKMKFEQNAPYQPDLLITEHFYLSRKESGLILLGIYFAANLVHFTVLLWKLEVVVTSQIQPVNQVTVFNLVRLLMLKGAEVGEITEER